MKVTYRILYVYIVLICIITIQTSQVYAKWFGDKSIFTSQSNEDWDKFFDSDHIMKIDGGGKYLSGTKREDEYVFWNKSVQCIMAHDKDTKLIYLSKTNLYQTLNGDFEIYPSSDSTTPVSGDFYKVFRGAQGTFGMTISYLGDLKYNPLKELHGWMGRQTRNKNGVQGYVLTPVENKPLATERTLCCVNAAAFGKPYEGLYCNAQLSTPKIGACAAQKRIYHQNDDHPKCHISKKTKFPKGVSASTGKTTTNLCFYGIGSGMESCLSSEESLISCGERIGFQIHLNTITAYDTSTNGNTVALKPYCCNQFGICGDIADQTEESDDYEDTGSCVSLVKQHVVDKPVSKDTVTTERLLFLQMSSLIYNAQGNKQVRDFESSLHGAFYEVIQRIAGFVRNKDGKLATKVKDSELSKYLKQLNSFCSYQYARINSYMETFGLWSIYNVISFGESNMAYRDAMKAYVAGKNAGTSVTSSEAPRYEPSSTKEIVDKKTAEKPKALDNLEKTDKNKGTEDSDGITNYEYLIALKAAQQYVIHHKTSAEKVAAKVWGFIFSFLEEAFERMAKAGGDMVSALGSASEMVLGKLLKALDGKIQAALGEAMKGIEMQKVLLVTCLQAYIQLLKNELTENTASVIKDGDAKKIAEAERNFWFTSKPFHKRIEPFLLALSNSQSGTEYKIMTACKDTTPEDFTRLVRIAEARPSKTLTTQDLFKETVYVANANGVATAINEGKSKYSEIQKIRGDVAKYSKYGEYAKYVFGDGVIDPMKQVSNTIKKINSREGANEVENEAKVKELVKTFKVDLLKFYNDRGLAFSSLDTVKEFYNHENTAAAEKLTISVYFYNWYQGFKGSTDKNVQKALYEMRNYMGMDFTHHEAAQKKEEKEDKKAKTKLASTVQKAYKQHEKANNNKNLIEIASNILPLNNA